MTGPLPDVELHAVLQSDGTGRLEVDGVSEALLPGTESEVRARIIARAVDRARAVGRPVLLLTQEPRGEVRLIVSPSGDAESPVDTEPMPQRRASFTSELRPPKHKRPAGVRRSESADPVASDGPSEPPAPPTAAPTAPRFDVAAAAPVSAPAPLPMPDVEPPDERADRPSFLGEHPPEEPPARGWRAVASRMGFAVAPSADELAERADALAVSRHWPRPRTIAVVNGKGGANKTPTTALLAAVFARFGGAGVLAWDNNETRGTLGWRTEQGPHDSTVHDLLPHAADLLGPAARMADLARYVHHQTADRYDVLRSDPRVLADQQRITRTQFDALHAVACKYYRLLFVDSGNDESADRWLQMVERADHLVIATTALGEHAEAGALLLEQLAERDARTAALASRATVVVSQSDPNLAHGDARAVAAQFRSLARAAVTIPYDDALHSGRIRYELLARPTRRAWLAAAAQVATALDA